MASILIRRTFWIPHTVCVARIPTCRHYGAATVPCQNGAAAGLYGYDHLKTPEGFGSFANDAISRSEELVYNISTMSSSADVVRAMDEISDIVCSVVDSAELCRQTHPDRNFVVEACKASLKMNEYLHLLNTNHTLYDAVKKAEKDGHLLSSEAHRACHHFRRDFENGGIHLSCEKLNRVNQIYVDIFQLSKEFGENISSDPGHVDIFPASIIPKRIHHLFKPIQRVIPSNFCGQLGSSSDIEEKGFCVTTDLHSLVSILQFASNEEVRKLVYVKGNSVPEANHDVLSRLIASRHELAQILGYKSYSEFVAKQNLASSSQVVMSFLNNLNNMIRQKADQEFDMIKNFKIQHCGKKSADLYPWDEAYYTGIMKSSAHKMASCAVASYFPLSQCIEGLKVLVRSLFGATFLNVPMLPGESWHPLVEKMLLHHPEEGNLGYMYLDLCYRKGKFHGCANFSIRGGRRISETMYQLPIVALVCNFSGSCGASIVLLNHSEVENLFHEFGHALHSLLSRTDFQHFAGARVIFDFAETPSNLFEYYAWDYRVLRSFARHYSTGEVIPEKLVQSMRDARDMFAATELQRQIFYAMVDQTLFGEQPEPALQGRPSSGTTTSIVADLKRQCTSWKNVEDGTSWHVRFSHLVNYGAVYYSYLYARCFAASLWHKVCQEDPLSSATGNVIREKLLQHGGAVDPAHLLGVIVGDGVLHHLHGGIVPNPTCLLEEICFKT